MLTRIYFYPGSVLEARPQTETVKTLYLAVPEGYPAYRPGHVVKLSLPSTPAETRGAIRPYCNCALLEDGVLEICVNRASRNGVSAQLQQYGPGQPLGISEPSGRFCLGNSVNNRVLQLIGLGSGIGVARGIMRHYYQLHEPFTLVQFYAIHANDRRLPYEPELEEDTDRYPGLEVYPILQPAGYDPDDIGERIMSHVTHPGQAQTFLAGPGPVAQSLEHRLLEMGFATEHFHMQKYQ